MARERDKSNDPIDSKAAARIAKFATGLGPKQREFETTILRTRGRFEAPGTEYTNILEQADASPTARLKALGVLMAADFDHLSFKVPGRAPLEKNCLFTTAQNIEGVFPHLTEEEKAVLLELVPRWVRFCEEHPSFESNMALRDYNQIILTLLPHLTPDQSLKLFASYALTGVWDNYQDYTSLERLLSQDNISPLVHWVAADRMKEIINTELESISLGSDQQPYALNCFDRIITVAEGTTRTDKEFLSAQRAFIDEKHWEYYLRTTEITKDSLLAILHNRQSLPSLRRGAIQVLTLPDLNANPLINRGVQIRYQYHLLDSNQWPPYLSSNEVNYASNLIISHVDSARAQRINEEEIDTHIFDNLIANLLATGLLPETEAITLAEHLYLGKTTEFDSPFENLLRTPSDTIRETVKIAAAERLHQRIREETWPGMSITTDSLYFIYSEILKRLSDECTEPSEPNCVSAKFLRDELQFLKGLNVTHQ
jgi:hypothetical protein